MSFLDKIKDKKRNLQHTTTIVKTVDGCIVKEGRNDDGEVITEQISSGGGPGYVVDLKPDLQVASVMPCLCMGSQDITQDANLLNSYGITHILSLGIAVNKLQGFIYHFINMLDLPEFKLTDVLHECFEIIDSVRNTESGGVVFVHCNAGVSRSASVVIAYVMKTNNCTYAEAFELLKRERPAVNPNPGFVSQLKLYEKILQNQIT